MSVASAATTAGVNGKLASGGEITGTVSDKTSGEPIAKVKVEALDPSGGEVVTTVETAANGTYTLGGLTSGSYDIRFAPAADLNYLPQFYPSGVAQSEATAVPVTAGASAGPIDIGLSPAAGEVSGTVVSASTHGAIAGAVVKIFDGLGDYVTSAETSATGTYSITGLAEGEYTVEFLDTSGGYVPQFYPEKPSAAGAGSVSVVAGTDTANINGALGRGGGISGRVLAAPSQTPLANVSVLVYEATGELVKKGETDTNGGYEVTGLAAGSYKVEFVASGVNYAPSYYEASSFVAGAKPVAVSAGQTTPSIEGTLTAGGAITGTVTEAAGGAPIEGAEVVIYEPAGQRVAFTETGPEGKYAVESLGGGEYVIEFLPTSSALSAQYDGGFPAFAEATRVVVSAGGTHTGVNAALGTKPENSAPPLISGEAALGKTLSCSTGEWSGTPAPTLSFQWLREGTAISGATASTYVVGEADQGKSLVCEVLARNASGVVHADSGAVKVAKPAGGGGGGGGTGGPAGGTTPPGGGSGPGASSGAPRVTLEGSITSKLGKILLTLACQAGAHACSTATVRVTVVEQTKGGRLTALVAGGSKKLAKRTVVIAELQVTLAAGETRRLALALNSKGRALLATHSKIPTKVQVRTGTSTVASATVTVVRPAKKLSHHH